MWGFTCFNHLWHGSRRHGSRFSGLSFCLKKAFAHDVCRKFISGNFDMSDVINVTLYLFARLIEFFIEEGTNIHTCFKILKVIGTASRDIFGILY